MSFAFSRLVPEADDGGTNKDLEDPVFETFNNRLDCW